ncbi:MAG: C45 family peptidase [bacterium]|nr:C45 family peptidase [bacterium]
MEKQVVRYYQLEGTYEEMGRQMAKKMAGTKAMEYMVVPPIDRLTRQDIEDALTLYQTYCPGLVEELTGFSKESGIPVENIAFIWMSYLVPGCSSLIVSGKKSTDGHTKIYRNYEFSIEDEDLAVCRTVPKGKYAHVSGTIAVFGRCEGINECGLAVSMSSCGFPVSNLEGMRPPKVKGLQFWAVNRTLLENCKNTEEALSLLKDLPIGFNVNLYLADETGNTILFETMDGKKAWKCQTMKEDATCLCGTNHIVIPEFRSNEPVGMSNSIVRYKALHSFAESKKQLSEHEVKQFMLTEYPTGMTTHFYEDWFGTIKTVVLDTVERRFSICWLGEAENGFIDFYVDQEITDQTEDMLYHNQSADPGLFELIPIEEVCVVKDRK